MSVFTLKSEYKPAGDQPDAIEGLVSGLREGIARQTLLGVTGSGKSVPGDTTVLVRKNSQESWEEIGPIIDDIFDRFPEKKRLAGETECIESSEIPSDYRYEAYSFDPVTKHASWRSIRQYTRHRHADPLTKVTTSCGREVTVTADHNFYTLQNGIFSLRATKDVKCGDFLPVPRRLDSPRNPLESIAFIEDVERSGSDIFARIPNFESVWKRHERLLHSLLSSRKLHGLLRAGERIPLSLYRTLVSVVPECGEGAMFGTKMRRFESPYSLPVTDELMRLIGYYVAEGHGTDKYFILSAGDEEIVHDIESIISFFGLSVWHRPESVDYQCSSALWTAWLGSVCGKKSRGKRLPLFWPRLSDKHLSQLLRAYFSGDGGVDGLAVTCSTVSRMLASEIATALLRFGIAARIRKRHVRIPGKNSKSLVWIVSISGKGQLEAFRDHIGFIVTRKMRALEGILRDSGNTNVDVVPVSGKRIRTMRHALGLRQRDIAERVGIARSHLSLIESSLRFPSRERFSDIVRAFREKAEQQDRNDVLEVLNEEETLQELLWTPIKKIKPVPPASFVYDFSVEDNETFLAGFGGVFVHNTFTVANVIAEYDKPALVLAHNKTLAAQLAQEYQEFFPDHAVHYFVSYYDYYQPEAYLPITDTYIEKDAQINAEIDRLRHASTQALLTRRDTIIVASVSSIYGLGSPEEYERENMRLAVGDACSRPELLRSLVTLHFNRTTADLSPGTFRALGNRIEVMPVSEKSVLLLELVGGRIGSITRIDPVSQKILETPASVFLFPAKHFVIDREKQDEAIGNICAELAEQLAKFEKEGKLLEAERLKRRTNYDLAMIAEIGYCNGIENYSRQLSFRKPGEAPSTLLDYFPHQADGTPDFLTVIDESHVTVPQIRGMYAGDRSRKETLVEYGFRLPSALDNRPLRYEEFDERVGAVIYTSATPGDYEREVSGRIAEQVIRPTGLVDPEISVRPVRESVSDESTRQSHSSPRKAAELPSRSGAGRKGAGGAGEKGELPYPGQIGDFIRETELEIGRGGRVLATTLTKRMAEDLSAYLREQGIRTEYLHSDVKTIERIKILTAFRRGEFDCLVGVNLLREGLDLPEVSFIGILDADKEGFLRSETSLIQTIGRAARNVSGRVILYADSVTGSMKAAIDETRRRRELQTRYNREHGITPATIRKNIHDITERLGTEHDEAVRTSLSIDEELFAKDPMKLIRRKETEMQDAVKILDFESAAILRDEIRAFEARLEKGKKRSGRRKSLYS